MYDLIYLSHPTETLMTGNKGLLRIYVYKQFSKYFCSYKKTRWIAIVQYNV